MSKERIEKEMVKLTDQFWESLKLQDFEAVDLIQKKMKRLEALMRIEEDEEEVKPNPAIPESDMLNFMKKLKKN